ncbi:D-ribitol-5-phosphate cytidylyltransferase isoform X6 [Mobula hypostoma]|uniref:D-ribitol-5-phosphate cytidylyltransferase isoform X6 n=1 Tax=Mobula hypostoma TaxID=723540 RepID=UPI002FC30F0B
MAWAGSDSQPHCKLSGPSEQAGKSLELDFSVAAVLPAGGSGERMGTAIPKQFCRLFQRPLISLTLEAFERVHWIKEIVVVVSQQNFEFMNSVIGQFGHSRTTVVVGGLTRHQSIFNGLKAFVENQPHQSWLMKPEVVIIHDAVRPFVEEDILYRVATAAKEHGCTDYDFEHGTECLHLALQYCGVSAKLLDGPPDLWKVTYKRDLYAAESIVKENLSKSACIITAAQEEPVQLGTLLQEVLQRMMKQVDLVKYSSSKESHCIQAISSGLYYNFIYINEFCRCWKFKQHTSKLLVNAAGQAASIGRGAVDVSGRDPSSGLTEGRVNNFEIFKEIVQLVEAIKNVKLSALYPVVVTVVHLNNTEALSCGIQKDDFAITKQLAKDAFGKNILIYNLLINYTQSMDKAQESVKEGALIIETLIKQRSPVLTGQLLVV